MDDLAELIANSHARWMPRVVGAIFGTNDPVSVAEALTEAVAATSAVPVVAAQFYEPGVAVVVGVELADGRAVVAKVHRATFMPLERLATIARVQADLVAAGVPAPAPLAGPLVLGNGWLTVEEHRDGDSADGCDPAVRRGMASALHDFVDAARPHAGTGWIGTWPGEPEIDDLWPEPHDLRFDFPGTPPVPSGSTTPRGPPERRSSPRRSRTSSATSTGVCRTWPSPAAGCPPSMTGTPSGSSPKQPWSATRR